MISNRLTRENERLKNRLDILEKELNKLKYEEKPEYLKVKEELRKISSEVNWSICTISKVINGVYDKTEK